MILIIVLLWLPLSNAACVHDQLDYSLEHLPASSFEKSYKVTTYSPSTREKIRISPLYFLDEADPKAKMIIQEYLIPAAIDYFQAALKVDRVAKNITISSDLMCGEIPTPENIKKQGVSTDLILIVTGKSSSESYLAYARACNLLNVTERAAVGLISYNLNSFNGEVYSIVQSEKDLITTLHEITHILGFSSSLFPYFRDPKTGRKVSNSPLQKGTANGVEYSLLVVEPLVSKLRKHFDCSRIQGAYLENQGSSNSQLSHFERRIFYNEFMTASDIDDARISEFTLAVLEGSGWYTVNYKMAEPIFWGKGKGCDFLYSPCMDSQENKSKYEEFCGALATRGCTFTGRSQGYCGTDDKAVASAVNDNARLSAVGSFVEDTFADNCPYVIGYTNRDCKNSEFQVYRRIDEEVYGESSMCFTGNILSTEASSTYCFEYDCSQDNNGNMKLNVRIGGAIVTCNEEGVAYITNSTNYIDCPDPISFCSTKGLRYCPRGCMGRGDCINNQCVCYEGWTGADCSFTTDLFQKINALNTQEENNDRIFIIVGSSFGGLAIIMAFIIGNRLCKKSKIQIRPEYIEENDENVRKSSLQPVEKESNLQVHHNPKVSDMPFIEQTDTAFGSEMTFNTQQDTGSKIPSIVFE